ncbi:hypothetical protein M422DRAFT_275369 [Sphaerobolus stellatus SS14]|uniref:Uncharacterized protein n=1 Tax=Sphaerobolus stellatus (strain SS14) TaxID=990650 RepID=A0A0C9UFL8_SPHS4|nr:hypothetical protein M422DRAFT_275369 [Sphaerobolus stellatus SS14]
MSALDVVTVTGSVITTLQSAVTLSLRVTETCTAAAEVIDLGESSSNESVRRVLAVITHGYPNGIDSGENSNAEVSDKEEGW